MSDGTNGRLAQFPPKADQPLAEVTRLPDLIIRNTLNLFISYWIIIFHLVGARSSVG